MDKLKSSVRSVSGSDPDPVPRYGLSVDELSRSLTVTVDKDRVHTRLCYRQTDRVCSTLSNRTTVSPPVCVCVHTCELCVCGGGGCMFCVRLKGKMFLYFTVAG